MPAPDEQVFAARYVVVRDIAAFVDRFAERSALGRETRFRLRLVLEELFTNTIRHGHRGESDATVRIALSWRQGEVQVHYEDSAPAFDPFSAEKRPLPADATEREPGGAGIPLVMEMANAKRYTYVDGRNCIDLVIGN